MSLNGKVDVSAVFSNSSYEFSKVKFYGVTHSTFPYLLLSLLSKYLIRDENISELSSKMSAQLEKMDDAPLMFWTRRKPNFVIFQYFIHEYTIFNWKTTNIPVMDRSEQMTFIGFIKL